MKRIKSLMFLLFTTSTLFAQKITIEQYIDLYKDIAMQEMIRTGVPASITLAQGIVETENGNSKLVKKSNNHFGIKCKETWTGPSVSHDDDAPGECFRKYNTAVESYVDHSDFLRTRKHYDFLFKLDPVDYKAWAYGLKKAGYATNPQYPALLIKYIETYNLNEYSLIAMGKKKAEESVVVQTETKVIPPPAPQPAHKQASKPKDPVKMETEVIAAPVATTEEKKPVVQEVKQPAVSYPAGEFKINETRVVYVTAGTPFLSIAQQYNIPLKFLFDFNDLTEKEILEKDQLIYLQRKRRTGAQQFHTVAAGESLYDIAQAEGIRLEALLQLNLLTSKQQPAVGEQLYLQVTAPVAPKLNTSKNSVTMEQTASPTVSNASDEDVLVHVVQPKETLYSIAKKYQVSQADLQHWNQLAGTELKEGMELIINKKQHVSNQGSR